MSLIGPYRTLLCLALLIVVGCGTNSSGTRSGGGAGGADGLGGAGGLGGIGGSGGGEPTGPACSEAGRIEAVTFNIRFDADDAETALDDNGWSNADSPRRERVMASIEALEPDILGVQEALHNQVEDLVDALQGYGFVGVGRVDGEEEGEYAGVFFREARFELVDSGHFWLSETPEVPGTVFEGSAAVRIASWARLFDQTAERELVFLNTHWDHASQESRELSAALIRERLAEIAGDVPSVVAGDLNVPPSTMAVGILLAAEPADTPQFLDGFRDANPDPERNEGTYHAFLGVGFGARVDYVLHTEGFETTAGVIVRDDFEGRYPSDHFPVTGTLRWTEDAEGRPCD